MGNAAASKLPKITPGSVRGLKFFKPILAILKSLHNHSAHRNRELFYDHYIALLLFGFYNPALATVRGLIAASKLRQVQKKLGCSSTSLGSMSEAARVFNPEPIKQLFHDLAIQVRAGNLPALPFGTPDDLEVLATDASLFSALPRMMKALLTDKPRRGRQPGFMLQVDLDLRTGVPTSATTGDAYDSEQKTLLARLRPRVMYILDRGYPGFALLQGIIEHHSSFIVRGKEGMIFRTLQSHALSAEALSTGVYLDEQVEWGCEANAGKIKKPLRLIRARVQIDPPHNLVPGGRRKAASETGLVELMLLTDRLDIPAEVVVRLYKHRWHVEIFFRWIKHALGCKHFISECENGFALQTYTALIATVLIVLYTGKKPCKAMQQAIYLFQTGWASADEFKRMIENLKPAKT